MQKIKTCKYLLITTIILSIHAVLYGVVIVNDLGDSDDFSTSSDIYLVRVDWEDNYNIPGDTADFIHQETNSDFWIFTTATCNKALDA